MTGIWTPSKTGITQEFQGLREEGGLGVLSSRRRSCGPRWMYVLISRIRLPSTWELYIAEYIHIIHDLIILFKLLADMVKNKGFLPSNPSEIPVQREQIKQIVYSLLPACTEPDMDSKIPFKAQAIIANPPAYGMHSGLLIQFPPSLLEVDFIVNTAEHKWAQFLSWSCCVFIEGLKYTEPASSCCHSWCVPFVSVVVLTCYFFWRVLDALVTPSLLQSIVCY